MDHPLPVIGPHGVNPHFAQLGGEAAVRRLVERFYQIMDTDQAVARIRGLHPPDLSSAREKLFAFLCGWLGGPPYFEQRYGHPRLRQRHLTFPIGDLERDQWISCMIRAMAAEEVPEPLRCQLTAAFRKTADHLRNQTPR
jgi:hemoglobin